MRFIKKHMCTYLFFLTCLLLFCIFYIVPLFMNIIFSLIEYGKSIKFVGAGQYLTLLHDQVFIKSLTNTGVFFSISTPLIIIFAYSISRLLPSEQSLSWMKIPFLMPLLIPSATISYAWNVLFGNDSFIGMRIFHFSSWESKWYDLFPLIVLYNWRNVGYIILIFIVGFTLIPPHVYEASSLDGANKFQQEIYITLGLMKECFFISLIWAVIQQLKIGRELFILYGEQPKESLYLLPTFFKDKFLTMNIEVMSSAAVVVTVIILLIIFLIYKLIFGWSD